MKKNVLLLSVALFVACGVAVVAVAEDAKLVPAEGNTKITDAAPKSDQLGNSADKVQGAGGGDKKDAKPEDKKVGGESDANKNDAKPTTPTDERWFGGIRDSVSGNVKDFGTFCSTNPGFLIGTTAVAVLVTAIVIAKSETIQKLLGIGQTDEEDDFEDYN
jgi:hypothetical protein